MSDFTRLEIDEYGPAGADGYGFLIELHPDAEEAPDSPPLVGHFAVTILRPAAAEAHPPTNLTLTKKVLTWPALDRFPD